MRVLYFSTGYGPHDQRFLTALARTPHEVHFLRLAPGGRHAGDRPVPAAIHQVEWGGASDPFRWSDVPRLRHGLRKIVREIQPDLIHAGPIQTCAFLAVLSGFRPVLTMSWGFDLMEDADRNPWWRWVTQYTLRRSTYFVSDARITRSRAVKFGMLKERTAIFPWGVDLIRFQPASVHAGGSRDYRVSAGRSGRRRARGPEVRRFILFCNRSWEPRYGVDVLARAFVLAHRKDPSLALVLAGEGSQAARLRGILDSGDAIRSVRFAGHVPQGKLPKLYREADLFISPSHVDGSSVSLMEALACGKPVLVSDIPANREWVKENENGWLFEDGDAERLADKIAWISRHRSVLGRIARNAREVAEVRADWSRNFKTLLSSYEKATKFGKA